MLKVPTIDRGTVVQRTQQALAETFRVGAHDERFTLRRAELARERPPALLHQRLAPRVFDGPALFVRGKIAPGLENPRQQGVKESRKFKRLSAADGGTGALGLRALHGEVSRSIGCVIAQAGDDGCAASLNVQRRTCDGAVADFELLKKSRRHLHRLDAVAQAPRLQAQLQP